MNEQSSPQGWWKRLSGGLKRTSASLGGAIAGLVTKRKLDAETLAALEAELIRADLGPELAERMAAVLGEARYEKGIAPQELQALLAGEIEKVMAGVAKPLEITARPFVILVAGVNGSGKTTTIGKLAARFRNAGKTVLLVAGDTFRAAAIDQLKIWGQRTSAKVIAREPGSDSAGLAFDALNVAQAEGADVLIVDTAGRLQNRTELMSELEKMLRVMKKLDPAAPHAVLLVLDATVGQNALSQVEVFGKIAGVTGLVMTKLDGTARGGILVSIAEKFKLPIHFIGVGEGVDDLAPFAAADFGRALAGIE
jgi:fused signal recognition particle receptor